MKKRKYKNIIDFFKEELPHLKVSKRLTKDLKHFRLNWSTKDTDYIDFLGSNLLGVHSINFSILDDESLMKDTLKIKHYTKLQQVIYEVDGIEKNFKIGSNIIYQTLMYIAHLYTKDKTLKDKDRDAGMRELCLIMQFRMFCSTYGWSFKYLTTESIATAVYNKLSHKFLIKQLDNWQAVFDFRASSCTTKKELNYDRVRKFDTEGSIRLITDIQIKLKEQIKHIYRVMVDITEKKEGLISESATFKGGESGEEQLNDNITGINTYINKIKNIAFVPNDFIDSETLNIISNLFTNIDKSLIYKFLKYMSDSDRKDTDDIISIIEKSMITSFTYLQRNNINIENREYVPKALVMVRNFWSASKVSNEGVEECKEFLVKEAFKCTGKKTAWVQVTLAISYVAYVFLRSLKK
ncbi:hypothetical protein DRJ25_02300 [Candidatus Woesearchaeota archaeon]|nr:MAG: hypothetical protein DRJ25_02300 [Candidatus Woesearchaeota archaeon]